MDSYLTIRTAAKQKGLSEHAMRTLCKCGRVPGFYSGNRFYVDMERFSSVLREISDNNVRISAGAQE